MTIKSCLSCSKPTAYRLAVKFGHELYICRDCVKTTEQMLYEKGLDWAFMRGYNHLFNTGRIVQLPLMYKDDLFGRVTCR